MDADTTQDLALMMEAARDAATLAMSFWGKPVSITSKPDGSPVTNADLAVDALLASRLRGSRPKYGWLSEESPDHGTRHSAERVWVLDPIDGTRNFIKGGSDWVIALSRIDNGVPSLSVVVNAVQQETFHANKGRGAFLNGHRIHVSGRSQLEGARTFASDGVLKMPIWTEPWPQIERVRMNSSVYRLALLASGRLDVAFSLRPKFQWDIAPGALLVEEAGGIVTTAGGDPLRFNTGEAKVQGFLAANPFLHHMLKDRVAHAAQTLLL